MSAKTDMTVKTEDECDGDLEFTDAERDLLSVWEKHWTAPVPTDFAAKLVPLSQSSDHSQASALPETAERKPENMVAPKSAATAATSIPIINVPRRSPFLVFFFVISLGAMGLSVYDHWHFENRYSKLNSTLLERDIKHKSTTSNMSQKGDRLSQKIDLVDDNITKLIDQISKLETWRGQLEKCAVSRNVTPLPDGTTGAAIVIKCDTQSEPSGALLTPITEPSGTPVP